MKLSEIDFRVWSKLENGYIEYPALAKLCSVLPAKVHRADRAIPFIEFNELKRRKSFCAEYRKEYIRCFFACHVRIRNIGYYRY